MTTNPKFPASAEIKRVIAAASRAGIEIGSIEIQPRKITIHPKDKSGRGLGDYDIWKMSEGQSTQHIRHTDEESDAPSSKPKG